jgi:PKD repeat protein
MFKKFILLFVINLFFLAGIVHAYQTLDFGQQINIDSAVVDGTFYYVCDDDVGESQEWTYTNSHNTFTLGVEGAEDLYDVYLKFNGLFDAGQSSSFHPESVDIELNGITHTFNEVENMVGWNTFTVGPFNLWEGNNFIELRGKEWHDSFECRFDEPSGSIHFEGSGYVALIPEDSSSCEGISAPSTVESDEKFSASILMKNTGSNNWRVNENYRLGSQNPQDNGIWGIGKINLNYDVIPDSTYTFTQDFTAPSSPGTYNFDWKMLQENVKWFGETCQSTITVTSPPSNNAPTLNPIGNKNTAEGNLLQFQIFGSDADGDSLSFSASNRPSGAVFNPTNRVFAWTPNFNQDGTYQVTFTVSDGQDSNQETITITVSNVIPNNAPTLNSIGNKAVNENSNLQFTVSGSDPDGDSLSFSASNLPSGSSFNPTTRTFSWTPTLLQAETYQVTFTVSDGKGGTDSETITITVNNVNRVPVITSTPTTTATEDVLYTYDVDVSDPDADDVFIFLVSGPSGMSIIPSTGLISWIPTDAQAVTGTHSVTAQVSDQKGGIALQTFSITVSRVNDAPISNDQSISTNEDTAVGITLTASDEEGGTLTFSLVSNPSNGVLTGSGASLTYTPNVNFNGQDSFTFKANDGTSDSNIATITISVGSVNDGPNVQILQPHSTFVEGEVVFVNSSASDVENDPLTFTLNFGDGTILTGNVVNNQVIANYIYNTPGIYTLSITVTDTGGLTDTDTVQVTILPFTVNIITDKTSGLKPLTVNFDSSLNGGNGPFTYSWDFNSDGIVDSTSKNPIALFKEDGIFIVTLTVTDADGDKSTNTLQINVKKAPSQLSRKKIHISQIRFVGEVQAGDDLEVLVNLENKDVLKTRELSVTAMIPELGLRKKVGNDQLRNGKTLSRRVVIPIPKDAKPGIYDVLITVNDHDTNRRIWREFRVI